MILDNLRVHHTRNVTARVEEHRSKIQLFYLPAYSPEYNPDEYLNHDLKRSIEARQQACTEPELQQKADTFMNRLTSTPEHVPSYLDHPAIAAYEEIKQSGSL